MAITDFLLRIFGARPLPPRAAEITALPQTLPVASVGIAYSGVQLYFECSVRGPVRWEIVTSSDPALVLSQTGAVSGVFSQAGDVTFTARVIHIDTGAADSEDYVISVAAPLIINEDPLPNGLIGAAYQHTFTAGGGRATFTWRKGLRFPAWATLGASTGVMAGTPQAGDDETRNFEVIVTDADGRTDTYVPTITVDPLLTITTASLPDAQVGVAYSTQLGYAGSLGIPAWVVESYLPYGPTGLALHVTSGILSGSVTQTGDFTINVILTDLENGRTARKSFPLRILPAATTLSIDTADLGYGTTSVLFDITIATSGGAGGNVFSITQGSLPAGIDLNASTGRIYGTTTVEGLYSFRLRVTDQNLGYVERSYSVRFAAAPTITGYTIPDQTVGTQWTGQPFTSTGGYGTITYAITSGSLPTGGLSMSSSGVVTGTPNAAGGYSFGITATDSQGRASSERTFGVTVESALAISTTSLPAINSGAGYSGLGSISVTGGDGPGSYTFTIVAISTTAPGIGINPTTGAFTGTAPSVTVATNYTVFVDVRDTSLRVNGVSYTVTVNPVAASISAPASLFSGMVGVPYTQTITLSNMTTVSGFARQAGQDLAAVGLSTRVISDTQAEIYGTPSGVLASGTVTLRATHSGGTTDRVYASGITIVAAPSATNDWSYRSTGAGVSSRAVMATRFDTPSDVFPYMFQNSTYTGGNPTPYSNNGTVQHVTASHANASILIPGNPGAMQFTIPPSGGEYALNWVRRLNDSWDGGTGATESNNAASVAYNGFGPGDVAWVYIRMRYPLYMLESRWASPSSGWKSFIVTRWSAAHPTEGSGPNGAGGSFQLFMETTGYRDILYPEISGGNGGAGVGDLAYSAGATPFPPQTGTAEYYYQGAVNHTLAIDHPVGLDPTVGTDLEKLRKSKGMLRTMTLGSRPDPTNGYDDAYMTRGADGNINPRGSDQASGALMWRRDCADQPIGVLVRFKVGTWGASDSECEMWAHQSGKDFVKLGGRNNIYTRAVTEALGSGFRNDKYGNVNSPGIAGSAVTGGAHKMNGLWLLHQNTGRTANSNDHPSGDLPCTYWYYEAICYAGHYGIPAPGYIAPPLTAYGTMSYLSGTPLGVTALTSTLRSRDTISAALPAEWRTDAGGNGERITTPYSECAWDPKRNVAYVHGGGHNDSSCNWILKYELGYGSAAEGFTAIDGSAISAVRPAASPNYDYTDGRPAAVHNYRGSWVDNDGHYYRFGGSMHNSGSAMPRLWEFNPSSLTWTSYVTPTSMQGRFDVYANYDWTRNVCVLACGGASNYVVFDCRTKQFSAVRALGNQPATSGSDSGTSEICLVNGEMRVVIFGNMSPAGRQSVYTWNGSTLSAPQTLTFSGDTTLYTITAPGCVWDREDLCFWGCSYISGTNENYIWRGVWTTADGVTPSSTNIHWTRHTVGGGSIGWNTSGSGAGAYPNRTNRRLFPVTGQRALLVIRNQREAPRLIRKPS